MANKIKCLIVDDEAAAHYVLQNYMERIERLELVGQCYNVIEAINFLHKNPVDLIFLDINMPELSGFDLLKMVQNPPKIILTTAYSEFALESYEYGAMDYLLKPIHFARFLKAVDRYINTQSPESSHKQTLPAEPVDKSFMVKVDSNMIRINPDDLLYAQSLGNYVKLFMSKQTHLATMTTAELERRLPGTHFMRIHKSYIIAIDKINRFSNYAVFIDDTELPVGITYRRELAERLK